MTIVFYYGHYFFQVTHTWPKTNWLMDAFNGILYIGYTWTCSLLDLCLDPWKKWQEINSSFTTETACPVTHANFFRLFTKSWSSLKPDYLVNGFRVTGIYPFNPSAIPNEAYLPSKLYADPAGTHKICKCHNLKKIVF